jgi:NADH-ubiquinone oxidoreductase chain 2
MLVIGLILLVLAVSSPLEGDLRTYVLNNRIVFLLFISNAYLAYNILNIDELAVGIALYDGVFRVNVLTQVFDIILLITGSIVSILTCYSPYKLSEISGIKEYSILLIFTTIGACLLISAQNLISIYLALELQSFTLYIIAASRIESFKGTSGGLKYFLLGGLSSGFILFGFILLYAYTGSLDLDSIFIIYATNNYIANFYLEVSLLLIFAGLFFKVSAAPFHNWAPDVYSDVPTISTTWLIVIAKVSVLVLILILVHNLHTGFNLNSISNNSMVNPFMVSYDYHEEPLGFWTNLITLSACLSLILGTIVGLNQGLTKRLLAYSTISHVGFLLAALSINSICSADAFIFYLIQYTLTNLNIFFIIIAWGFIYTSYYLNTLNNSKSNYMFILNNNKFYNHNNKIYSYVDYHYYPDYSEWYFTPVPYISQLKGMHFTDPFLAFCLAISIFSLAGIPPLIGFFAKQQVLLAAMQLDYYFLSFIIVNTSVIGAAYYLRIIKFIFFFNKVYFSLGNNTVIEYNTYLRSNDLSLFIALFTNIILFYIFKPYIFLDLVHLISNSLNFF